MALPRPYNAALCNLGVIFNLDLKKEKEINSIPKFVVAAVLGMTFRCFHPVAPKVICLNEVGMMKVSREQSVTTLWEEHWL